MPVFIVLPVVISAIVCGVWITVKGLKNPDHPDSILMIPLGFLLIAPSAAALMFILLEMS